MKTTPKIYKFNAKVWRWPGDGGWYFITLPKNLFLQIRAKYPRGMVAVETQIGKTVWQNKLFPHTKYGGEYIMAIKKVVRQKEDLFEGDEVKVSFKIR